MNNSQSFCEECGAEIPPGAAFCSECGHPVVSADASETEANTPAPADAPETEAKALVSAEVPETAVDAPNPAEVPEAKVDTPLPAEGEISLATPAVPGGNFNTRVFIGVAFGIVLTIAVAMGVVFFNERQPQPQPQSQSQSQSQAQAQALAQAQAQAQSYSSPVDICLERLNQHLEQTHGADLAIRNQQRLSETEIRFELRVDPAEDWFDYGVFDKGEQPDGRRRVLFGIPESEADGLFDLEEHKDGWVIVAEDLALRRLGKKKNSLPSPWGRSAKVFSVRALRTSPKTVPNRLESSTGRSC